MRKEYKMTPEQLKTLMSACQPVQYIIIGGHIPKSPQQNANDAWASLGKELGFDYMSVQRVDGKGQEYFTAEIVQ